jgi:hypothetical protein
MQEIIERYIAAWNEADPERRRELIDSFWTADGSYTDPLADVRGRDGIDVAVLDGEGRIGAVYGFLDKVPAGV